jgi:hypothetical protein
MSTAYIIVTLVAAAMVAFSAGSALFGASWVTQPLADYGVPRSWLPWLGTAKAAGATGLLIGLFVPIVGTLAGICLVLYFIGAVITVIRARWYSHVVYPLMYVAPVVAALGLAFGAGRTA